MSSPKTAPDAPPKSEDHGCLKRQSSPSPGDGPEAKKTDMVLSPENNKVCSEVNADMEWILEKFSTLRAKKQLLKKTNHGLNEELAAAKAQLEEMKDANKVLEEENAKLRAERSGAK